jgi:hypothetical protein
MIPHGCDKISEQLASQADGVAYLEDHRTWPRGGERVSAEIFVPQRVLRVDLVAFQAALEALSPAHTTQHGHGAEHLAQDLCRQLGSERASDAVIGEVRLSAQIDRTWVWEHVWL